MILSPTFRKNLDAQFSDSLFAKATEPVLRTSSIGTYDSVGTNDSISENDSVGTNNTFRDYCSILADESVGCDRRGENWTC